jgi:hypothetical protein
MNIGDNGERTPLAYLPKASKIASVETNYAGIKAVGIEIVIKHKIDDLDTFVSAMA